MDENTSIYPRFSGFECKHPCKEMHTMKKTVAHDPNCVEL